MPKPQKIATCCYCGTRAALVLGGQTRHELSCASCGAPLRDLKMLPVKPSPKARSKTARRPAPPRPSRKKVKRRKPAWYRLLDDAIDVIEDIFD